MFIYTLGDILDLVAFGLFLVTATIVGVSSYMGSK